MGAELILFDNKFDIKENKILLYLYNSIETTLKTDGERFVFCFTELYRFPIFKTLLDAILSEIKNKKNIKFILKPQVKWDRLAGHCATSFVRNFDQKLIGEQSKFSKGFFQRKHEIVIKNFSMQTIIHEIGHAIEHISGIDIERGFRQNFSADMKTWDSANQLLGRTVKDLMLDQLKNYPLESTMAELFARFFEILSMANDVDAWMDKRFSSEEIQRFYRNTVKWFYDELKPILLKKTDPEIAIASAEFVSGLQPIKKKWTDKIKSKFANVENPEKRFQEAFFGADNPCLEKKGELSQAAFKEVFGEKTKTLDTGAEYVLLRSKKRGGEDEDNEKDGGKATPVGLLK
ncbi:MAG: hypothetical protein LBB09_00225 [Rickettsiales bacterium]|jgi:hypothetical protein|nr:hypothetical protein [Rickettsiales bacterium]